jgi:formiminotetrahydrofolate cyclodeaminase
VKSAINAANLTVAVNMKAVKDIVGVKDTANLKDAVNQIASLIANLNVKLIANTNAKRNRVSA